MPSTPTHCPYCALQCGMYLTQGAEGLQVEARQFPTNKGGLCRKGWTSAELLTHSDRLTCPLIRRTRQEHLQPVTWTEALEFFTERLQQVQSQHGKAAAGVFGGGGLTNESAYLLGKFARVALSTPNIDYNGRYCMSSAAAAANMAFGLDRGLPFPLSDIAEADTVLLAGGNLAETMPPIMQYFDGLKKNGGQLIVCDPRRTLTAVAADLHLQPVPGTDMALAYGMLHIAQQEGLLDRAFIQARTEGFESLRGQIASFWPERVERITGVPAEQLHMATIMLGMARKAIILTARGVEQHSKGVDNALSFINLALALGHAGRAGSGWGCITGQGNGQGGREHGQKADQLPGYRSINNPQHRKEVATVWGVDPDSLPGAGCSAQEMLESLGDPDGVKALLVIGSNPVVSAARAGLAESNMHKLELLAVADFFLSDTAKLADIVFPVAQWAEMDGTVTNLEGRVIRRCRAVAPPAGVPTDTALIAALAERMGCRAQFPSDPHIVFQELSRASAGGLADYAGITWERIEKEDGVFWPCPTSESPGTPRLFLDGFAHPGGRAKFHAVRYRNADEEPCQEYPLYLTTGRVMAQYQSGVQTGRVKALKNLAPEVFVELHPHLASQLGVADKERVCVRTRRGAVEAVAHVTGSIRADTIFMPFHFGGSSRANLLTNSALDPISKMPEFKICAACIEKMDRTSSKQAISE